jgi:hypothetical protein
VTSSLGEPHAARAYRRRYAIAVGLIVGVVLVGVVFVGTAYYHVPDAVQHRLSQPETLDGTQLQPPGVFQWPRLAYGKVLAHCSLCASLTSTTTHDRSVQLGLLVRDDALAGLVGSNAPNRPHSPADVPLPRLVWVVEWNSPCWGAPPGASGCTTYDIVDDQTGLELDASQVVHD